MTDHDDPRIKQPTDHLPPTDERRDDDDRTTAESPYPIDGAVDEASVSPATAAEPDRPDRHNADKMPPGAR